MSGYSGETEFDFEIERYRDNQTDQLLVEPLNDDEVRFTYNVITLTVEGRSYFQPGRTYGLPENCYPDEGDTEITSVIGSDGNDWSDKLTEREKDSLIEMIQENVQDGLDEPDPDDYYDDYED
jgi:hypothetical protein